jgi:cytidine deaminase
MNDDLFDHAKAAREKAYAPYSRFQVGAAIRAKTGAIFVGGNVENAAYPEGWCAETSAIAAMVQAGESQIEEILIVGDGDELCTPCGGCRQRIREFSTDQTKVSVCGLGGVRKVYRMADLLPDGFGPGNLA